MITYVPQVPVMEKISGKLQDLDSLAFVQLLRRAEMEDVVYGKYTVFVPTDRAVQKLLQTNPVSTFEWPQFLPCLC